MKTPITYYGGKQSMTGIIVPMIEYVSHTTYTEPFFGGGAVFFTKQPSPVEVINDRNKEVVNFYKTVKSNFEQLNDKIQYTLHSREQHRQAQVVYDNPDMFDKITRAWSFWCLANQSFSSNLVGGWGYGKLKGSSERKLDNKRMGFTYEYTERLKRVQIECTDALKVIKSRDHKAAFHYCDPPYINSDQGHYGGYTEHDFKQLLNTLQTIDGKFLMSSYPSDILKAYIKKNKWHTIEITKALAVSNRATKKLKIEVLTANYDINSIYANLAKK